MNNELSTFPAKVKRATLTSSVLALRIVSTSDAFWATKSTSASVLTHPIPPESKIARILLSVNVSFRPAAKAVCHQLKTEGKTKAGGAL